MNPSGLRRFVTSFSTWFIVPEQGMKELEILNRGSAFLVKTKRPNFPHKYHVITASHVVAPWRWKQFYSDDFLGFVSQKNTHYTAELRNEDGTLLTQVECIPRAYHHPKRDLAVLHLFNEQQAFSLLAQLGLNEVSLAPRPDKNSKVIFHGHEVTAQDPFSDQGDVRLPVPQIVPGSLAGWTKHQTFCTTQKVLNDGMCGGAVLLSKDYVNAANSSNNSSNTSSTSNSDGSSSGGSPPKRRAVPVDGSQRSSRSSSNINSNNNSSSTGPTTPASPNVSCSNSSSRVCGVIEGIVGPQHEVAQLRGMAVFVESDVVQDFLDQIESGELDGSEYCLVGGEAARAVMLDQDPAKMDVNELMKKL